MDEITTVGELRTWLTEAEDRHTSVPDPAQCACGWDGRPDGRWDQHFHTAILGELLTKLPDPATA